jgi:hypothetical protein
MAEKIKLKISPAVARFVRPGVSVEDKLSGLANDSSLEPFDRVTLLFCLSKDADSGVKGAAGAVLAALSDEVVTVYIQSVDAHPSVLDALAANVHSRPEIAKALLAHEMLSSPARESLQRQLSVSSAALEVPIPDDIIEDNEPESLPLPDPAEYLAEPDDFPPDDEDDMPEGDAAEINEEDEQYLSKFQVAQVMGISEKIKMALSGDKEWRAILVKDANKLVSGSVLKNPRITEAEILRILMMGVQNDEIIRLICANREWVKNYRIRKALIDCPKTPLANSMRYMGLLNDKDLARYAKSKNISSVLSTTAKRMVLAKQKKR